MISSYTAWIKGDNQKLSNHFSTKEFECRCSYEDCRNQKISDELISRLEKLRLKLGVSIVVTSGYRCSRHQADLLAKGTLETVSNSQHVLGNAADVTWAGFRSNLDAKGRPGGIDLDPVSPEEAICATLFKAVGIGYTFVHLDLREDKERRWSYSY